MRRSLKRNVADLNNTIEYWNTHGGAPQDEFNKIVETQNQLRTEAARLNGIAAELNMSAQMFNADVKSLNNTITEFNTEIRGRPEMGVYDHGDNTITIFFYTTKDELVHTLSHEFGHALNFEHTDDSASIMYPYTTSVKTLSYADIQTVKEYCRPKSVFEIFQQHVLDTYQILTSREFKARFMDVFKKIPDVLSGKISPSQLLAE